MHDEKLITNKIKKTMNENIDLTKILKDCPKGTEFYSCIYGKVRFDCLKPCDYPVLTLRSDDLYAVFSREGKYANTPDSECCLFPSKEQRDWSKFEAPWYKKDKFDPKTLKPFDRVLVRDECYQTWKCGFFSHITDDDSFLPYITVNSPYARCIPYNDETKHLVGTAYEAPEYYKYWED